MVAAVVAELARRIWLRSSWSGPLGGRLSFGLLGLVLVEHAFQESDGIAEAVVELDEQVDVVDILSAVEAVGEVVARVDGGAHFAAMGTDETEVTFADFGRRLL